MLELSEVQVVLIGIIFIWSGFVRSGLGFGGSVLALPFLLLVDDRPLVYLPVIAVHLLFFSSITIYLNNKKGRPGTERHQYDSTVDWPFMRYALSIMIVPKLIGVIGLITLPAILMSTLIFCIISVYAISYLLNKPFKSKNKTLDIVFLMLGGYFSGTSLIGAPLVIAVFVNHVAKHQMRDTLLALWFILVSIKTAAFIYAKVDMQLQHHLWLLPCAGAGHIIGLKFHQRMLDAENAEFYRLLGSSLLVISLIGLWKAWS